MDIKSQLNIIEKEVFATLKPLGFKKNGRTFNRTSEEGIVQVVNFQSEKHKTEENYFVDGVRENLYGKFVVNLGVCIVSLYKFQFPNENNNYCKEYDCQIRERLGKLLPGQDYWWTITDDNKRMTDEIIDGLATNGLKWFSGIETKEKIIANSDYLPYNSSPANKLDISLIVWFDDKEKGSQLFREYYNSIEPAKLSHKLYVRDLAKELGIEV